MKVWIVEEIVEHEGRYMVGVFSTEEKAEEAVAIASKRRRLKRHGRKDPFEVYEVDVDYGRRQNEE